MGLVGRVIGHIFLSLSLPSYIFDIKLMIKSLGEILDRAERVLKRKRQGGGVLNMLLPIYFGIRM